MSDLTEKLKGRYSIIEDGRVVARYSNHSIPSICKEAADRIEKLESMLLKKLDLIKCGIGANYSGNPFENELYLEVVKLLENGQ